MSLKFLGFTIFKLPELRVSHVLRFASLKFHNLNLPELWVSQVLGYSSLVETASFRHIEFYKAPYSNGTLRLSSELLTLPTKILHVLACLYDRIPTCMQILVNSQYCQTIAAKYEMMRSFNIYKTYSSRYACSRYVNEDKKLAIRMLVRLCGEVKWLLRNSWCDAIGELLQ